MNVKRPAGTNRLRVLRAERRISQMDAAAHLGMSRDRFWKIENGFIEPTEDEERALARLFKVQLEEIFPDAVA